jgi:TP53 regulating kinase and related kinases
MTSSADTSSQRPELPLPPSTKEPEGWEKSLSDIEVGSLLFQGAESRVYTCLFYNKPAVLKHRFVKRYRNETLDERLRSQRTRHEARALERCVKKGIRAPRLLGVDYVNTFLVMTHEEGPTVKEALDQEHARVSADPQLSTTTADTMPSPVTAALLRSIGVVVAMLHNANIVHGDLTTSNFISTFAPPTTTADQGAASKGRTASSSSLLPGRSGACAGVSSSPATLPTAQDIVVLDFGLISDKYSAEERAVDLYVLERAIASTHPYLSSYASAVILDGYRSAADPKKGAETMKRLEMVRARGRKRSMVG